MYIELDVMATGTWLSRANPVKRCSRGQKSNELNGLQMSKDNTIVVLETLGNEFRVADCQAAENLFYYDPTGDLLSLWDYFHDSKVFKSKETAYQRAHLLEEEDIKYTGWGPEYGVEYMYVAKEFPEQRPECPDHVISSKCSPPSCFRCGRS